MSILDDFAAMHCDLMDALGEPGKVMRGEVVKDPITVFPDDAVQDLGQYGRVVSKKRVVGVLKADWQPQRGDLITVRGTTSKVEEIASDDGIVVVVVMNG